MYIDTRLPKPIGRRRREKEQVNDDAWAPWVVKGTGQEYYTEDWSTGFDVKRSRESQTLHGYPHLALAAMMWCSQIGGRLDNDLLLSIHANLLGKVVSGLKDEWMPRDVLFIVEILRLICFEKNHPFEWTPVP